MDKKHNDFGMGCLSGASWIIFIVLFSLKLSNTLDMPWIAVFSPFIGLIAISISMRLHDKNNKED